MADIYLPFVKNKVQTKYLSADTTSDLSDLNISNLVIGKWYEVKFKTVVLDTGASATDVQWLVSAVHNGSNIERLGNRLQGSALDIDTYYFHISTTFKFKATATTLTWSIDAITAATFLGDGTIGETYVQIEERNDLIETSEF